MSPMSVCLSKPSRTPTLTIVSHICRPTCHHVLRWWSLLACGSLATIIGAPFRLCVQRASSPAARSVFTEYFFILFYQFRIEFIPNLTEIMPQAACGVKHLVCELFLTPPKRSAKQTVQRMPPSRSRWLVVFSCFWILSVIQRQGLTTLDLSVRICSRVLFLHRAIRGTSGIYTVVASPARHPNKVGAANHEQP